MVKIIIGIILIMVLLITAFLYKFLYGGLPEVHNKVNQYGQWEDFAGYSGLKIFPENILKDNITEYYYKSQDIIFSPEAQIFMEAVYDEKSFEKEITRLFEISVSKGEDINYIIKDMDHFLTTAYVCEYNWSHCYEYALVFEEDKKIDYIFLQNIDIKDIEFNKSYLPENYGEENEDSSYCIYVFGTGKNVLYYE